MLNETLEGSLQCVFWFRPLFSSFIVLFCFFMLKPVTESRICCNTLILILQPPISAFIMLFKTFHILLEHSIKIWIYCVFQDKETICKIIYLGLWTCCLWSWKTKDSTFSGTICYWVVFVWWNMLVFGCLFNLKYGVVPF